MIRTVTCVTVTCDSCNESAGQQDDEAIGEIHFTDPHQAADRLPRWRLDPATGRATCPDCVAAAQCVAHGHSFEDWRRCGCQGRLPAHCAAMTVDAIATSTCPMWVRWCRRCERVNEGTTHCPAHLKEA